MKCIWKHLCLSRERCRTLQEPCLGCQDTECITASLSCLSQAQLAPHKSPLQSQPPSTQKRHLCLQQLLPQCPLCPGRRWLQKSSPDLLKVGTLQGEIMPESKFSSSCSRYVAEEGEVFPSSCSSPWSSSRERLCLSVLLSNQVLRTNPYLQVKHLSFPYNPSTGRSFQDRGDGREGHLAAS